MVNSRNMGNNRFLRQCSLFLFSLLSALLVARGALAFERTKLPSGALVYWGSAQAAINLGFGCPETPLSNWGPCWDDAATDALNQWNTAAKFRFSRASAQAADPCAHTDRVNTTAFASSICGAGFGPALAVTIVVGNSTNGELIDADTLVDSARPWSTYPGPLQRNPATNAVAVYDFHRVVMHEFGHSLGLNHPDVAGQTVNALMNSRVSDTDGLQADDIAGVNAIYPLNSAGDALLEDPPDGSTVSGISIIRGWACSAGHIDLQIDGATFQAAYPTIREDTRTACGGRDNTGFSFLFNWNRLGPGTHQVIALRDGVEFDRATVNIVWLGTEFLKGVNGAYLLPDFPIPGHNAVVEWRESLQNFLIVDTE